ncbi:MAG: hypothetical protein ACI3YH_04665, partial [Eubacteriales bacterium]
MEHIISGGYCNATKCFWFKFFTSERRRTHRGAVVFRSSRNTVATFLIGLSSLFLGSAEVYKNSDSSPASLSLGSAEIKRKQFGRQILAALRASKKSFRKS